MAVHSADSEVCGLLMSISSFTGAVIGVTSSRGRALVNAARQVLEFERNSNLRPARAPHHSRGSLPLGSHCAATSAAKRKSRDSSGAREQCARPLANGADELAHDSAPSDKSVFVLRASCFVLRARCLCSAAARPSTCRRRSAVEPPKVHCAPVGRLGSGSGSGSASAPYQTRLISAAIRYWNCADSAGRLPFVAGRRRLLAGRLRVD